MLRRSSWSLFGRLWELLIGCQRTNPVNATDVRNIRVTVIFLELIQQIEIDIEPTMKRLVGVRPRFQIHKRMPATAIGVGVTSSTSTGASVLLALLCSLSFSGLVLVVGHRLLPFLNVRSLRNDCCCCFVPSFRCFGDCDWLNAFVVVFCSTGIRLRTWIGFFGSILVQEILNRLVPMMKSLVFQYGRRCWPDVLRTILVRRKYGRTGEVRGLSYYVVGIYC